MSLYNSAEEIGYFPNLGEVTLWLAYWLHSLQSATVNTLETDRPIALSHCTAALNISSRHVRLRDQFCGQNLHETHEKHRRKCPTISGPAAVSPGIFGKTWMSESHVSNINFKSSQLLFHTPQVCPGTLGTTPCSLNTLQWVEHGFISAPVKTLNLKDSWMIFPQLFWYDITQRKTHVRGRECHWSAQSHKTYRPSYLTTVSCEAILFLPTGVRS